MYECTKVTPANDIFPFEIRTVLENIVTLKKVPIMHLLIVIFAGIAHWCSRTVLNIDLDWNIPLVFYGVIIGYPGIWIKSEEGCISIFFICQDQTSQPLSV